MTTLTLATRNLHKTREFALMLGGGFAVTDLSAVNAPPVEETGSTFEENAALKAIAASAYTSGLVAADDSGLEVDSLEGAPGIYSARYAGENATDADNMARLLRELERVGCRTSMPRARFRCAIAIAQSGALLTTFAGSVEGTIAHEPRGSDGFGYDPVFVPDGSTATFAELSPETKNAISHRGRAAAQLCEYLRQLTRR